MTNNLIMCCDYNKYMSNMDGSSSQDGGRIIQYLVAFCGNPFCVPTQYVLMYMLLYSLTPECRSGRFLVPIKHWLVTLCQLFHKIFVWILKQSPKVTKLILNILWNILANGQNTLSQLWAAGSHAFDQTSPPHGALKKLS